VYEQAVIGMTNTNPYLFQNLSWEYYFYLRSLFQEHN